MEAPQPLPTGPDVDRLHVPEELHQQLHEANLRFHRAKQNLEQSMEENDYDHGKHVKQKLEELRSAEKEVEDLTAKVQEILGREVEPKKN